MLSSRILVVLSVGLFIAATASASPVTFDGDIDANDSYFATLTDGDEATVQNDLDIKSVGFDLYGGYFWMGLEVWAGPLETDGGAETMLGETFFYARFETGSGTDMLEIILDAGNVVEVELNGFILTAGVDYEVVLGSSSPTGGLEIKISDTLLAPTSFTFFGQLDDTGWANDDNISGFVDVPEPVTLTLIAIGVPLVLIRRRRRQGLAVA